MPRLSPVSPESWATFWRSLGIFALAFCVRIVYTSVFVDANAPLHDDAAQYDYIGWSMAQGGPYVAQDGYRSHRAPGQSVLLAAVYAISGHDWNAARVVQAGLGAATGVLVLSLGSYIFGPEAGTLAGLVWAVFPYSLFFCSTLLSEPLCTFLTVASTWALVRAREGLLWTSAWAFFGALAALTRPNMALAFALGVVWLLIGHNRRVIPVLCGVLIFCLTLLPWTIRNYVVHHRLVPITTMGGVVLWEANNPYVMENPALWGRAAHAPDLPEARLTDGLSEADADAVDFRLAADFIRHHPKTVPWLVVHKFLNLWNPFPQVETEFQRWGAVVTVPLMVVLLAVGLVFLSVARRSGTVPLLLPIAVICVTALVYWADARIRAPADPEIVLVCVWGAIGIAAGLRRRSTTAMVAS